MEWFRADDCLPLPQAGLPFSRTVLVHPNDPECPVPALGVYARNRERFETEDGYPLPGRVTHWMPLPPPPEG
jgi:hypothetical protein